MKPARDGIRLRIPGVRPPGVRPPGIRPPGPRPRRGSRWSRRRWRFRGPSLRHPAVRGPLWALLALGLALACSGNLPGPVSQPPSDAPVDEPVARAPQLPAPPAAKAEPPPPAPPADRRPAEQRVATGPLVLRVGLATDLAAVTLPCCDSGVNLEIDGGAWPATAEIAIEPAGTVTERAVYRLQVAALKDELQAAGIADYLKQTTEWPADSIFDADIDLYRVRVGRFADRAEAETGRGALEALGIGESWITSEGGSIENPAFEVSRGVRPTGVRPTGGERRTVAGRWLDVSAAGEGGIRVLDGRFRGRILVYLNDRGLLNVINEIELEEYLRGVVPMEMGPELYNAPEALKAQAVAARTFAVKNLDGFAREGYDICSTPRCQVYGGMTVEHRRSDAAVRDTAGQVALVFGEPAETFYGATCGGHTENVEVIFPLKRGAHLRGVPCLEAGAATLAGDLRPGAAWPAGLTERLLPPPPGSKRQRVLSARLEHLALLAALPVPRDHLRSMARKEVLRFVTSVFDLALDRRFLSSGEELRALVEEPPADWQARDRSFARYLAEHLLSETAPRVVTDAEVEVLLYRLALHLGVLYHERARFLALEEGRLTVRLGAERRTHGLPADLATFRRRGGTLVSGPLELMAGDRLDFYWRRGDLIALAQPVEARQPHLDGRAPRQSWNRFMTRRQLTTAVQARYPGFPFEGFEVLSRGVSGRVGKLKLLGSDGRSLLVEGLAVRWTLDLHDTLFDAQPARPDGREAGWFFRGRGWGHGVGMCQAGAYGMAVRGNSYRAILEHYYTGIELGRLKPVPARPRIASAPR